MKINSRILKNNTWPIVIIVLVIILAFWKLLLLKAMIKWDNFDFGYPISIFISDSFRSGNLPLWNPYIYYGQPLFSQMGVPIWSPITLFLALVFGYSLQIIQLELILYIIFAGLFMYLLCYSQLYRSRSVSVIIALSYALSGFFIGNAQHIAWVISATWFPLSLYFILKGIRSNRIIHFLWAGVPFALIITGGYPGFLFIGYFILFFLIFYFKFIEHKDVLAKKENIFKWVWDSLKCFGIFAIASALLASISLLPFVETMKYMTRGELDYSFASSTHSLNVGTWLTFLFPSLVSISNIIAPDVDISMINLYIGLLPIIFIPVAMLKERNSAVIFFGLIGISTLIAAMGRYSFLHELLFEIVPFFDTFRFPSLYRYFAITFFLLLSGFGFKYFLENNKFNKSFNTTAIFISIVAGIAWVIIYALKYDEYFKPSVVFNVLQDSGFILLVLYIFLMLTGRLSNGNLTLSTYKKGLIILTIFTLLHSTYINFYVTVAQDTVGKKEFYQNVERNRDRNFNIPKNILVRQKSPVNNHNAIWKEFVAEGYNPYKLKTTMAFLASEARKKTAQLPLFYLTDNIVTEIDPKLQLDKLNEKDFQASRVIIDRLPESFELKGKKITVKRLEKTNDVLVFKETLENKNYLLSLLIKSDTINKLTVKFLFNNATNTTEENISLIPDNQWHTYVIPIPQKGSHLQGIVLKSINLENIRNPQLLEAHAFQQKTKTIYRFTTKELKLTNNVIYAGEKEIVSQGDDPILELPTIKWSSPPNHSKYVTFDLKVPKNIVGNGKIYYSFDPLSAYSELNSIPFELIADDQWHNYKISLPLKDNLKLRIDPFSSPGTMQIDNIKLEEEWMDISNGKIEIVKFEPNRIVLNVQSLSNQVLVITQSQYPGWKARVDNKPIDILTANINFRAIALQEGNHQVEMVFRPVSFYLGMIISLLTGGFLILFTISDALNSLRLKKCSYD